MSIRQNMELTAVFHKKKGKVLINTLDAEKFLKKNKAYSLNDPSKKIAEEKLAAQELQKKEVEKLAKEKEEKLINARVEKRVEERLKNLAAEKTGTKK